MLFSNITIRRLLFVGSLCLVLGVGVTSELFGQGKLSRVSRAARKHDPPKQSNHHDSDDDDSHTDGHRDDHGYHSHRPPRGRRHRHKRRPALGSVFFGSYGFHHPCPPPVVHRHVHVVEPAPVVLVEPVEENYFEQAVPQPVSLSTQPTVTIPRSEFGLWSRRLSATFGTDFDGIGQGSFGLLLQTPYGLGLDTSVNMLRESGADFRDHLWIGDFNVVYEAINTGDFRARMGVGLNWLSDHYGGEVGANLTVGLDWQLSSNWILTGESDFGSLGDADLFRGEISLGKSFGNAEWSTGYRHTNMGGVSLGSVFTGFRFRL